MTGKQIKHWTPRVLVAIFVLFVAYHWVLSLGAGWARVQESNRQDTTQDIESRPVLASPKEYLVLVNKERAKVGVKPLVLDPTLNKTAKIKVNDMIKKGYYDHNAPDGTVWYELIRKNRPVNTELGENLDRCALNVQQDVESWIKSPTHYQGMVDKTVKFFGSYSAIDKSDGCMVVANHFSS